MKTTRLIILIFACAGLFYGCSKFDSTNSNPDNGYFKKATQAPVFLVEPSGGDDTPAINQAFMDAKDAGAGSIVQLMEGEYHLGFLEVCDFYGAFRGTGKGKTIITVMNNLDAQAIFDDNLYHDLVKFVGGDICLSDFSIRTPPGKLTISGPPQGHIRGLMNFAASNARHELGNESRSINVLIDNVSFKGQYFDEGMGFYKYKYNCMFGIRAGYDCMSAVDLPRDNVNFKITNSDFDTFCYGLVLEGMKNGTVVSR